MFRPTDPQKPLFETGVLLPREKQERCEKSWAGAFRRHALPILRNVEPEFADLFDAETGRPNRPVELVVGTLILKEMNDLTDEEALSALEFDARWWYALGREPHETHLCQKTLHNFRDRLLKYKDEQGRPDPEKKKLAFRRVTDELIQVLGVSVAKQRLDSTHIVSNIAIRNRLGLFVDVIRKFVGAVAKGDEKAYERIPEGLRGRYELSRRYEDVRKSEGTRRLGVAARDVCRLEGLFEGHEGVSKTEEFRLLRRFRGEQCDLTLEPAEPKKEDDDHGEGGVCAVAKEAKEVESSSVQSAHDPEVTYSGHKGKGYEVQVTETCVATNEVQLVTDVEVTRSCQSDQNATVPTVERLEEAGHKPQELTTDTAFSGGENAAALAAKGVNLLAPAAPTGKPEEGKTYEPPAAECPKEPAAAVEWLRQQEASPEFKERYKVRAGIEPTIGELKNKHGMKKLRVRRGKRVKLAVYFKALALNLKRALRAWLAREQAGVEGAACLG